MIEVILYDTDNTVWTLDVTESVVIPLQFGIADVREPDKAKGTWSKTATFNGTANNNKALKHIYEISAESNFNVNKKVRCVIIEHGVNTFFGYVRLLNIKRKNNGNNDYNRIKYELSFFGETADFFKEIIGLYLHDLDLSEWNHNYTPTIVTNSATGNTVLNGVAGQNSITLGASKSITSFAYNSGYLQLNFSTAHGYVVGDEILITKTSNTTNAQYNGMFFVKSVESSTQLTLWMLYGTDVGTETGTSNKVTMLGTGYVYPMLDFGLNFGDSWDVEHFFPSFFVKEYWDKIFSDAGYSYTSNFIDSQFFKHLTIPFNRDTFNISQDEVLDREFKATLSSNETTVTDSSTGNFYAFSFNEDIIPDNDSTNGNSDLNGNYYVPTGEYTAPATGNYNFNWNILVSRTLDSVPVGYSRLISGNVINVVVKSNGVTVFTQPYAGGFTSSGNSFQGNTSTLFLNSGDVITFHLTGALAYTIYDTVLGYYSTSQDVDLQILQGTFIQCRITNTTINEGALIEVNNAIPREYLQSDFISSIIKQFKLFVQPSAENPKHLIIEPRDDFYSSDVLDWTAKLNIAQDIDIVPMGELNSKRYILKYKSDKDAFNQNHEEYYGEVYGTQTIDVDNDFVTGESILEPIFSATPLIDYPIGTDRVISSIVKDGSITQNRIASNIRILYYSLRGTQFPYTFTYNAGSTTLYTYPYAGHLDNVWLPYYDLNFGYPKGVYYNYGAWTDNNLYNRFHRRFIEEVTSRNSKLVRAWLHLKPSDINTLDFSKFIRIDEHLLRLNKIIDYVAGNNGTTLCEFILVQSGYNWAPSFERVVYGSGATVGGVNIPLPSTGLSFGGSANFPRGGGSDNYYGGNNKNVEVNGDGNTIGFGAKNVVIIGDDNTIGGGVENVFVFGNGNDVTVSNSTYRNGVCVDGEGSIERVSGNFSPRDGMGTFFEVDSTTSDLTFNLPPADELIGIPLSIKKMVAANNITITPSASELIDGATTLVLTAQYDAPKIISDGIQWNII